jgi:hypothetical protein
MSMEIVTTNGRRDEDIAAELRAELRPLLESVAAIQNRATKHGLQIGWQLARDAFGRNFVQSIEVIKPL